jgi:hypothetical protein
MNLASLFCATVKHAIPTIFRTTPSKAPSIKYWIMYKTLAVKFQISILLLVFC